MDIVTITPPAVEPVTVAQVKEQAIIEHDADDALVSTGIKAAVLYGQDLTGRQFVEATFRGTMDAFPSTAGGKIELKANLQSVTSITYTDSDGESQTWAADQYEVKTDPLVGYVKLATDCSWPAGATDVIVTFKAGWPVVEDSPTTPEAIQLWIMFRAATWYAHRETVVVGTVIGKMSHNFIDGLLDGYRIPVVP